MCLSASFQGGPASFPGQRAAMPPTAGNSLLFKLFGFSPGRPCQLPRSACGYAARCPELPTLQIFVALLSRGALPASPVSVRPCRPPPGTPCLDFSSKRKKKNIYIYISERYIYIYIYIRIYIYIYPFSTLAVSFLRSLLSELRQTSQATRKLAGVAPEHLSPCFSSHAVSFQQSC